MRVFVVTPPEPVVTLEEAKVHLKVEHDDENLLIEALVAAATAHIDGPDGWLGRAIGIQTLEARLRLGACPALIRLRYPPIVSIENVRYLDADRVEVTAQSDTYELIGNEVIAIGAPAWASAYASSEALRVRFVAGYAPRQVGEEVRSTLPAAIRAAILLMVGDLYRNRAEAIVGTMSAKVDMSTSVAALLQPFRVYA